MPPGSVPVMGGRCSCASCSTTTRTSVTRGRSVLSVSTRTSGTRCSTRYSRLSGVSARHYFESISLSQPRVEQELLHHSVDPRNAGRATEADVLGKLRPPLVRQSAHEPAQHPNDDEGLQRLLRGVLRAL